MADHPPQQDTRKNHILATAVQAAKTEKFLRDKPKPSKRPTSPHTPLGTPGQKQGDQLKFTFDRNVGAIG